MITLPPMPRSIAALPRDDRGYPVPWFVKWLDGKPEFRCADQEKLRRAIGEDRCWVCGTPLLDSLYTFVIGPMCVVNRTTAEPGCHHECAEFSAKACPFLSMPNAKRRDANMPPEKIDAPGFAIQRNPGVTCLWTTERWKLHKLHGGSLFALGDPYRVEFYREGRPATREEVLEAINSGLPILQRAARQELDEAESLAELGRYVARAMTYLPAEA